MRNTAGRGRSVRLALGLGMAIVVGIGLATWSQAADHRDSPLLTSDRAADIADVYSFVSPANSSNVVLAMTVSGLIPPAENATTRFDPDVLYQFEIDNNGDAVEDVVIQAFVTGSPSQQVMHFRGPAAPDRTGNTARLMRGAETGTVRVSSGASAITATRNGMSVFAGVRDDPFYFDLSQFQRVIGGQASGFRNPGVDAFAGTNVLAIVVEVPASMLGGSNLNIWGTTHRASDN
jgi:hypothetical protein